MAYEFQESIQRGIVYLAKSDDNFLVQAMPMVKETYFEFPQHQKFWTVIKNYYGSYKKLPSDEKKKKIEPIKLSAKAKKAAISNISKNMTDRAAKIKVLSPEKSIESKNSFGGTASREIKRQIRFWKRKLNA